jgi:hypothetical protein
MYIIRFILCKFYSSSHSSFFSLSCNCHEENCIDFISNIIRQNTNEIQNGRTSALYLKTHSKHLFQTMDRVYSCLQPRDSAVTSCQLPVRRPVLSQHVCRFAVRSKGVRKLVKATVRYFRKYQ